MSIYNEGDKSVKTSPSANEAPDDVLLIELLRRGYDISKLIQNDELTQLSQSADEETPSIDEETPSIFV